MGDKLEVKKDGVIEETWYAKNGILSRSYTVCSKNKVVSSISWRDHGGNKHELTNFDLNAIFKILEIGKYKLE